MIVNILKSLGLYTYVKRKKDEKIFNEQLKKDMPKLLALYKPFIKRGDLVFDCGSAYGNRTKVFVKLGAGEVVMVEPLYYYLRFSENMYGNTSTVIAGLSNQIGFKTIYECSSPTLSTFDKEEVESLKNNPAMRNLEWLTPRECDMTTLDELIKQYGIPSFIKLDIEGYELEALQGLSQPIKGLSFEFHTYRMDKVLKCIDRLEELGTYEYNISLRESFVYNAPNWISAKLMKKLIKELPEEIEFGDVYARLKDE